MSNSLYNVLNKPFVYQLAQNVLGAGAEHNITSKIQAMVNSVPAGEPLLDVGCGPKSWLWKVGLNPVGVDVQESYIEAYKATGAEAHLGSADDLPFENESFHGVWSIGVFHHLPDQVARGAIQEALRVCRKGGYVSVFDAVLPRHAMTRPLAYAIRKADRGDFMRTEESLYSLFPSTCNWSLERFSYAYTGLEMLSVSTLKA